MTVELLLKGGILIWPILLCSLIAWTLFYWCPRQESDLRHQD